MIEEMMK